MDALEVLSVICGWVYFFAWSLSFYPQVYDNWRRKSVVGLSFDFLLLNQSGYLCYSIYNCVFYFSPEVQRQYFYQHPNSDAIPVKLNDVVFAVHGMCLTAFTLFQCWIFDRGNQRFSWVAVVLTVLGWASVLAQLIAVGCGALSLLWWVYYLSYLKLAVTASKYAPQVWINFKRKCTQGWSIGNVLLDTTGGFLSFVQMFLDSINMGNWSEFTGNPTKLGLSVLSLGYDSIFLFQHYVLYRGHKPPKPHASPPCEDTEKKKEVEERVVPGEQETPSPDGSYDEMARPQEQRPLLGQPLVSVAVHVNGDN
eukprot:TRINITY_DN8235_c0_g1_i1.p1 TRINITY_DN8235_c0_g1~~TRINITY_DN8235_c0_g1_i1.p1  ORF type:complete len:333 (-),score=79.18 TRINITY_DN8235_c0_g1_i1:68-994(-)